METSYFCIHKNFQLDLLESYSSLVLKPEVVEGIRSLKLDKPMPLHQHCLKALLSGENNYISSPPATGKSSLLAIALAQLIHFPTKAMQFMIIEGKEHLIKETYINLQKFSPKLNYFLGEMSTKAFEDYIPFKKCQVAIASRYKMLTLLRKCHRNYNSLRFVVLDAIPSDDQKLLEIMEILQEKAPHVKFWWFDKLNQLGESETQFIERFLNPVFTGIVAYDHRRLMEISHFYVQAQNEDEKVEYVKKIIELNKDYQKVVFCKNDEVVNEYLQRLSEYFPGSLLFNQSHAESGVILRDFGKRMFDVLISANLHVFARRMKTEVPLYVIILTPVDVNSYEILTRRAGESSNDRIFMFSQNNDEISMVDEIREFYKINISKWPNANDA